MVERIPLESISDERLRNTRAWAATRLGQMSGAEVIVGAIDELLERRAADETPAQTSKERLQNELWDAINRYATACGGDPSSHVYGNTTRQRAVADVERVLRPLWPSPDETPQPASKDVVSEVLETYGCIIDRDAHGTGHYEGCWKDHWACVLERVLDEAGRLRALLSEKQRVWCDTPLPGMPYPEYACGKCWTCRVRAALAGASQVETPAVAVAGDTLPTSLATFEHRATHWLGEEQAKANPDNALIALLCDAVRLARENERLARAPLETDAEQTLTNDQCQRVVAALREHEWSGISNDDVRLWDSLIEQARLKDRPPAETFPVHPDPTGKTREPPHCPSCHCTQDSDADIFTRAVVAGVARWEYFSGSTDQGEVCVGGLRYATRLNIGVPILGASLREALERHTCWKRPAKKAVDITSIAERMNDATVAKKLFDVVRTGNALTKLTPEKLVEKAQKEIQGLTHHEELILLEMCWRIDPKWHERDSSPNENPAL